MLACHVIAGQRTRRLKEALWREASKKQPEEVAKTVFVTEAQDNFSEKSMAGLDVGRRIMKTQDLQPLSLGNTDKVRHSRNHAHACREEKQMLKMQTCRSLKRSMAS